ncbi:MAG: carbohydrate ABC transporter permease [Chloroflexi bacterium]|nr:carbohydrate ABC transporter permease [Chloroflexota bacterium]
MTQRPGLLQKMFLNVCVILLLIYVFAPLAWLFISSISTRAELLVIPPHWIPEQPTLQNYADILFPGAETSRAAQDFGEALGNSIIVSAAVTLISLVVGALAAYAFARLTFPFRQSGLLAIVGLRMLPAVSVVIPLYVILRDLTLLNTRTALVLLYLSFTLPFVIWVMTSFFLSLPRELEDAARVDGCSRLGALWRVIIPISTPGLVATGVFAFLLAWDEFFFALLFTSTPIAKTVPVAIAEFTGRNAIDFSAQATGGVLAAIPPVVLALIFQRYIVRGLTAGAVKG